MGCFQSHPEKPAQSPPENCQQDSHGNAQEPNPVENEKQGRGGKESNDPEPEVAELANSLARDIVQEAVEQCTELEDKYKDIPFIETDSP